MSSSHSLSLAPWCLELEFSLQHSLTDHDNAVFFTHSRHCHCHWSQYLCILHRLPTPWVMAWPVLIPFRDYHTIMGARFDNTWTLVESGPADQDQTIRESPTIKHCHGWMKCKLSPIFGLFVDINISQCRRSAAPYQVGSLTRGNMNWTSLSSLTLPGRKWELQSISIPPFKRNKVQGPNN